MIRCAKEKRSYRYLKTLFSVVALMLVVLVQPAMAMEPVKVTDPMDRPLKPLKAFASLSKESATCATCHREDNIGLYNQWGRSKHYGANVGCYECHKADADDPDAYRHKGKIISTIVSPKDCGRCHEKESKEFQESTHAGAADFEGSTEHALAMMAQSGHEGKAVDKAAGSQACVQCHGAKIQVNMSGKLLPETWPNSGIGRINPDGSRGACSACHQRHEFSQAQARRPEACGKCHLGPGHPQKEIYNQSKHGVSYYANVDRMNLNSPKWIPGEDYDAAPTCATCHMSATKEQPLTHNTSLRNSWNLRKPIAETVDDMLERTGQEDVPDGDDRRDAMADVCISCHSERIVENFYKQFDSSVELYNKKFAEPGKEIMEVLAAEGLISKKQLDDTIEWTWFRLWHHAGRAMRHGAAMNAPSVQQWQGMYELSQLFYTQLIPQARELATKAEAAGNKAAADKVRGVIDGIATRPEHSWLTDKQAAATTEK
ncbi:multiheme c-type cytochrome [Magnetococcus sp. PR-3]|uniref:multiheme c-type cytochrome n=1 Tax=Magnetococcus sp. PR-3 TaxID=3120355 RepID=UPI002FCE0BA6